MGRGVVISITGSLAPLPQLEPEPLPKPQIQPQQLAPASRVGGAVAANCLLLLRCCYHRRCDDGVGAYARAPFHHLRPLDAGIGADVPFLPLGGLIAVRSDSIGRIIVIMFPKSTIRLSSLSLCEYMISIFTPQIPPTNVQPFVFLRYGCHLRLKLQIFPTADKFLLFVLPALK
ncbi:hypothetical protein BAE44_0012432 [Dichanthelium oligosanthes]|uniref:Uncharacterized protein n=1 Tax=Dichanthelium oligosanthes TaxID=888268 RepID=A0A1E5VN38_9POAL|nr:hypothetical protein BAE44_0012432 [Dichanthelium oligosanthes]